MNLGDVLLGLTSLLLAAQSAYAAILMLYIWEDSDKRSRNGAPATFDPPRRSFTLLLPARHEEEVIRGTIQRMVDLNYPRALVQILVIIEGGDTGTIAQVNAKIAELWGQDIYHVRLVTFHDKPINKPHGLNVGLRAATGDVVTIFDAEDAPHPDILQVINTTMEREAAPVVQCGVQLMNYADRWFSGLNVLEYFFWFKSRMHFHASVGMVPLGGNTIFIRRDLLEEMHGWDMHCLTEDADIGIRLSVRGIPIRIMYDDRYVTQEETPPTIGQFIKQRTRWNQGFLQVLGKRDWLRLPTWPQRLLAVYTLAFPLLQTVMIAYLPVSLFLMFFVKLPLALAILTTFPLYMVFVQMAINIAGLFAFRRVHALPFSLRALVWLVVGFFPYQWVLGIGAVRAVVRQSRGLNTWEKTKHVGAHLAAPLALPATPVLMVNEKETVRG